jgi:transcriptional regulator with XRE-family HTH domain
VKGLRREEVAILAGVSVDYYARLERGNLADGSESVLEAVAGALQLDDAERQHQHDLARSIEPTPSRRRNRPKPSATPRPAVLAILAGMTAVPAYVRNARGTWQATQPSSAGLHEVGGSHCRRLTRCRHHHVTIHHQPLDSAFRREKTRYTCLTSRPRP